MEITIFPSAIVRPFGGEPFPANPSAMLSHRFLANLFREMIALLPDAFFDPQASQPSDICPKALLCVVLVCLNYDHVMLIGLNQ